MPPVPVLSGTRVVRALEKAGFKVVRIRGSHHVLRHPDGRGTSVPVHGNQDVRVGTLRAILRDRGLTAGEFLDLCRSAGRTVGELRSLTWALSAPVSCSGVQASRAGVAGLAVSSAGVVVVSGCCQVTFRCSRRPNLSRLRVMRSWTRCRLSSSAASARIVSVPGPACMVHRPQPRSRVPWLSDQSTC